MLFRSFALEFGDDVPAVVDVTPAQGGGVVVQRRVGGLAGAPVGVIGVGDGEVHRIQKFRRDPNASTLLKVAPLGFWPQFNPFFFNIWIKMSRVIFNFIRR